jgi:hypothetical protein
VLLTDLLDLCDFNAFPFDFRPTQTPQIWAGERRVLHELTHFRDNVMANALVEFGVITGQYGSGKSHSLLHLRYLISEFQKEPPTLTVYIENPCGLGEKGRFTEVYQYTVSQGFGRETVRKICERARSYFVSKAFSKLTPEEQKVALTEKTHLNEVARQLYQARTASSPITFGALSALADNEDDAWEWLTDQESVSNVGGDSVQAIGSHLICAKALATLIRLATLREDSKPTFFQSVFILSDQTEDLAQLRAGQFQEQIAGWRTLLDEVDGNFGLLWAMDGASEDIVSNFTEAISRRMTADPERLRLVPLSGNAPKEFLTEVMKFFRKPAASVPSPVYPFDDASLEALINSTPEKRPSYLLGAGRKVLTKAASKDLLNKRGDILSPDDVATCLS